jgi:hypothetical protein
MNKVRFGILFVFVLLMSIIGSGCVEQSNPYTGYSVDVRFLDGHYEQYNHVISHDIVEKGIFSYTVDLHIFGGKTIRLHYVTSIDIID